MSNPSPPLVPIILSGGSGTRLWPVSRESRPKPFMTIRGKSLLQRTIERAAALPGVAHLAVVTNVVYSYKTAEELLAAGAPESTLLLEPAGRNTAPAIAMAALWARQRFGGGARMLVLPADHLIDDQAAFAEAVDAAAAVAADGRSLALFGIRPTEPATGYGYIECGDPVADGATARRVARFVEKPDAQRAAQFLAAGNFFWNGGMFCFGAQAILDALARHAPDVMAAAEAAWAATDASGAQVGFDAAAFAKLPDISIDYAVMERADQVAVVPCRFDWSDIGSWKAVAEAMECDAEGNACEGNALFIGAQRTFVHAQHRLVAAMGVEDLVVVDTADAVLVAHKDSSQQVKDIVARLRREGHAAAREHVTVERPWGTYTVLHEAPGFKVKRIEVKPGHKLSLQLHHKRSEHWVVVEGTARVTVDERVVDLRKNQSVYVPIGSKHRLENVTAEPVVMVEVQCGDYLGEDDIVRFDDRYGRVPARG